MTVRLGTRRASRSQSRSTAPAALFTSPTPSDSTKGRNASIASGATAASKATVGRRPTTPTIITHTWTEGGREKSKTVRLSSPGRYEIVTSGGPTDVSIEMSVPSGGK